MGVDSFGLMRYRKLNDDTESGLHTQLGIGLRFRATDNVGIVVGGMWERSEASDIDATLNAGYAFAGVRTSF